MKKGADPAVIFTIMDSIVADGVNVHDISFKPRVISQYNAIHKIPSMRTKISNEREQALIAWADEFTIIKLPQDGNGVDMCAFRLNGNTIEFRVSQQKGNNSSMNASGAKKAVECLDSFIDEDKIQIYFDLLPDEINPNKTGYEYTVEVFFGFFLAADSGEFRGYKAYSNNDYLRKMGITKHTIVDLDRWVVDKVGSQEYDAISACENFHEVFNECLTKYI